MSKFVYFPLIKTRDAELRAFQNLSSEVMEQILPIYELTKSRTTKKAPDGDIHRRMRQICEIQDGRPFILDLSTDNKYINPQIEQLVSPYDGFKDWQYFLNLYKELNIIPMVHLYEADDDDEDGSTFKEVESFVANISKVKSQIAVRLPHDLSSGDYKYYLEPIIHSLQNECKLIVLLDANFVSEDAQSDVADIVDPLILSAKEVLDLDGFDKIEDVVMLCTSFPSSPAKAGNEDAEGKFKILEENIYQGVIEEVNIKYGDYASINTQQIEMKGGTFVPRIDIALEDGYSFIYKRYRRNDGSYPRCAKSMLIDSEYSNLDTWADSEILLASEDTPTGISPSFWISVRMVYYINTRVNLRNSD
ncbi:hypothetical protein [Shewanella sp. AC91-MNA-CIBAN-0169]|jgi:hypothetical protein|uniref:beta family protein n=1 Tax=Shewanella sp. AC91-MNA-CIBAN-0169 TaxID=3140466 RepID=UPI0033330361